MNEKLQNYLNLIIPQPLEKDEYIRLVLRFKKDGTIIIKHTQTFDDVEDIVNKYKFTHNIFISLSTYRQLPYTDKPTESYRRQVILLDFDKKDFPEFKGVADYSSHVKSCIPWLFNHCIVSSGSGGFHFYIATEITNDIEEITEINKRIATLTKADLQTAHKSQIIRVPTSYNLKNPEDKKFVKVINNYYGKANFKRYALSTLKNKLYFMELNNNIDIPKQEKPIIKDDFYSNYYCVEQMLNLGCKKGERNFTLGRIIAKLKKENYQYHSAKGLVLDWNKRCSPPKSVKETERDFDTYWNNDTYKLLGCNLPDGRFKNILNNYCDKSHCLMFQNYEIYDDTRKITKINEKFLDKRNIRRLNGVQYLIILMLTVSNNQLPKNDLLKLLVNNNRSRSTVKKNINKLLSYKIIAETSKGMYALKQYSSNYTSDITIKLTAIEAFVYHKINSTAFKIYLALNVLLQKKNCATYDVLAEYLDMEKSSISGYIKNLNQNQVLKIQKVYNNKGLESNRYTFI